MVPERRAQYCRHCQCHAMFRWEEPKHHAYSALTLAMIGTSLVTPATGLLMLGLWAQRIFKTRRWACPHCHKSAVAA
ncbi:MAG: hypothetical protein DWQ34_14960 [Planctomycetota bacterium]|nr:MAG: hypothetical protein DWQ29_13900 [Planctomycetota bacterium]REJ91457.1 MAG: hypothetical protein DWQ34_14960 [Planctomycetota bacterium]REK25579.1 MAG: hypothetical protein DWQ41_11610 [Planctomycetota bacterium]REK31709.1 MAG: hypothetical protein DWQ45_19075 [Planctomycetota bacterium]